MSEEIVRSNKPTVLVTGATGFLGGHCVAALANRYRVVATGRNPAVLAMLGAPDITTERIDLTTPDASERMAAHLPDVIVHAAALSSPWGQRHEFEAANVDGTEAVLHACSATGARLVHLSTPTMYMNGEDRLLIDEDARLPDSFINDYATTKFAAEQRVLASPVRAAVLRPQAIIGAGDVAIAPRFERLARRGVFPMVRGSDPLLDVTHVANVVAAIETCCQRLLDDAWAQTEVFNITNGDPRPLSELAQAFIDARNAAGSRDQIRWLQLPHRALATFARLAEAACRGRSEPIVTRYTVELLATSRTLSIDKARSMLDYDPLAHTIEMAFVEYFASQKP